MNRRRKHGCELLEVTDERGKVPPDVRHLNGGLVGNITVRSADRLTLDALMAANGAWNGALVTLITSSHSRKRFDSRSTNFDETTSSTSSRHDKCCAQKRLA